MNELRISVSMEIDVMLGLFDSDIWGDFYSTREVQSCHWQASISDEPVTAAGLLGREHRLHGWVTAQLERYA
jgi:hypothetical protein